MNGILKKAPGSLGLIAAGLGSVVLWVWLLNHPMDWQHAPIVAESIVIGIIIINLYLYRSKTVDAAPENMKLIRHCNNLFLFFISTFCLLELNRLACLWLNVQFSLYAEPGIILTAGWILIYIGIAGVLKFK